MATIAVARIDRARFGLPAAAHQRPDAHGNPDVHGGDEDRERAVDQGAADDQIDFVKAVLEDRDSCGDGERASESQCDGEVGQSYGNPGSASASDRSTTPIALTITA